MSRSELSSQSGQSLVQVLITVGIMGIITMALMSMITNGNREARALQEKLAVNDTQQFLSSSLLDGSVCGYVLNNPAVLNFDSTNLPQTIPVNKLYANIIPGTPPQPGPVTVQVGQPASLLSNSLIVQAIKLEISGGGAGNYSGKWTVDFDSSKLVRPLKSVTVSTVLQVDDSAPTNAIVKTCAGAAAGGNGQTCGMRSVYCVGGDTTAHYEAYNSANITCNGAVLTTNCNATIPANFPLNTPDAVNGCPAGYTGNFTATGVYFVGYAYQNNFIIYCVKN